MEGLGIVVVDMQDEFLKDLDAGARSSLIEAQRQLLAYASKEDIPTIALEYAKCGRTIRPIRQMMEQIPRGRYYAKEVDDGFFDDPAYPESGTPAAKVLRRFGVKTVCFAGVNAAGCVRKTAEHALVEGFNIITSRDLIANGRRCNSEFFYEEAYRKWYEENGVYHSNFAEITGGRIIEPVYTPSPTIWSRLKNSFH